MAASSLCLFMLSVDRIATVKHPRLAQLRQRQFLPSILASLSWIGAGVFCVPFLLVYKVKISSTTISMPSTSSSSLSGHHQLIALSTISYLNSNLIAETKLCVSEYASDEWHIIFIVSYISFVFIVPIAGVILNHIGN